MPISIEQVIENINPERTVLLLGSGSSIPSGAPSVSAILSHLAGKFGVDPDDLTLRELTDIIHETGQVDEKIPGTAPTTRRRDAVVKV
jgi:hypothetical protein